MWLEPAAYIGSHFEDVRREGFSIHQNISKCRKSSGTPIYIRRPSTPLQGKQRWTAGVVAKCLRNHIMLLQVH